MCSLLSPKQCPILEKECYDCPYVEKNWYFKKLLEDLAIAKAKIINRKQYTSKELKPIKLSPREICWLSLILNGMSITVIKKHLYSDGISYLTAEMSKTIYNYIKELAGLDRIIHWSNIPTYLEKYKRKKIKGCVITVNTDMDKKEFITIITESMNKLKCAHSFENINILAIEYLEENIDNDTENNE